MLYFLFLTGFCHTGDVQELEKRLTLLDQLSPASPLLLAGSALAPMTPLSPATAAAAGALAAGGGGPEVRQQLLTKKKELEDKVGSCEFRAFTYVKMPGLRQCSYLLTHSRPWHVSILSNKS